MCTSFLENLLILNTCIFLSLFLSLYLYVSVFFCSLFLSLPVSTCPCPQLCAVSTNPVRRKHIHDPGLKKNEKLVLVKDRVVTNAPFSIEGSDEVDASITGTVNIQWLKVLIAGVSMTVFPTVSYLQYITNFE